MKFIQILSEGFIRRGRTATLVHILMENDGEASDVMDTDCRTDGVVDDEKCLLQSLSRIILFLETGRMPRPHYDYQDAAIELEAIAHFLSDMSESDPRMAQALDSLRELGGGVFWSAANDKVVAALRSAMHVLKSKSNVEYEE
jgi:hypothetical protein